MKIGKTRLRMSDGSIRRFKDEQARDDFERIAEAVKHGWKPTRRNRRKRSAQ